MDQVTHRPDDGQRLRAWDTADVPEPTAMTRESAIAALAAWVDARNRQMTEMIQQLAEASVLLGDLRSGVGPLDAQTQAQVERILGRGE